eukprot:3481351-Pleurochrysis_carterae.AAC.1
MAAQIAARPCKMHEAASVACASMCGVHASASGVGAACAAVITMPLRRRIGARRSPACQVRARCPRPPR